MGAQTAPERRASILVVEDHSDSRLAVVTALERAGYEVLSAEDGRIALDFLSRRPPDVVVLDLMMPVFSGWELLRVMRAQDDLRMIPIVVVSAYYTPHRELGPVRFVPKPANMEAVLRAVRDSLPPPPISEPPSSPTEASA
jgi:CheY-like chemotaxis protein